MNASQDRRILQTALLADHGPHKFILHRFPNISIEAARKIVIVAVATLLFVHVLKASQRNELESYDGAPQVSASEFRLLQTNLTTTLTNIIRSMKLFFAMVLLSMANQHSDAVRLPALKATVANIPPGRQIILSQPIQEGPQNRSEASSREIAQALDQLNCHNDPMCFIQTAQSLAERGEQLDLALACVERAMAIPPVPNDAIPRESFFLTLAYVQIRRLEFDQAIATLTRGAQRSPEYARVDEYLTYLGLAYESSGRIDEAIETYVTLAGGLRDISREPSERLVALYRKRFGSLDGLKEKIDANRLKARKKFFVDSHLLDTPAPTWSLQDLDGRQFKLADFSKKILVVSFLDTGGNVQEPMLKFLQAQYEKYKDQEIAFVLIDYSEHPDTKLSKTHLERLGVTIPTLIDYSKVAMRYNTVEPLIVLIDEEGVIRFRNTIWHDYHPFVTEPIEYLLKSKEK